MNDTYNILQPITYVYLMTMLLRNATNRANIDDNVTIGILRLISVYSVHKGHIVCYI